MNFAPKRRASSQLLKRSPPALTPSGQGRAPQQLQRGGQVLQLGAAVGDEQGVHPAAGVELRFPPTPVQLFFLPPPRSRSAAITALGPQRSSGNIVFPLPTAGAARVCPVGRHSSSPCCPLASGGTALLQRKRAYRPWAAGQLVPLFCSLPLRSVVQRSKKMEKQGVKVFPIFSIFYYTRSRPKSKIF